MVRPFGTEGDRERRQLDPRYRLLCDIAHQNGTPVSFEAARWTDHDLTARLATLEAEAERCPQCRLSEDAAKTVAAVIDSCPTCEARDTQRRKLSAMENAAGRFVRWHVLDPDDAWTGSAWVNFTAEGARARKAYEAGEHG